MKQRLVLLLAIISFVISSPTQVQAGFWTKKKATVTAPVAVSTAEPVPVTIEPNTAYHKPSKLQVLKHLFDGKKKINNDSGWQGITSLICGVFSFVGLLGIGIGLWGLIWLSIPAIVFGILGLRKKYKGMALAGLILGGAVILLLLAVVLLAVLLLGGL